MVVYLIPNPRKQEAVRAAQEVAQHLLALGAEVLAAPSLSKKLTGCVLLEEDAAFSRCDVVVTVGGDGTMLHAARRGFAYGKPLLGVNCGRMGFLATVEANEPEKLTRLVRGEYTLDRRAMLSVHDTGRSTFRQMAMNDVVLCKSTVGQTAEVEIFCDGKPVNHYMGDGVIVATPTGSTAYSLSAGGPILDARIAGLVLTPICAHSMHSPPMVFSAGRKLTVKAACPFQGAVYLSCDGGQGQRIGADDTVEIALSNQYISLVSFNGADQFEAIDTKLKGR